MLQFWPLPSASFLLSDRHLNHLLILRLLLMLQLPLTLPSLLLLPSLKMLLVVMMLVPLMLFLVSILLIMFQPASLAGALVYVTPAFSELITLTFVLSPI